MSPDGAGLARARGSVGFSQDDVARFVGVNRAMVSYWETGSRRPNDRQLAALARLYGVSIAELLMDEVSLEPDYAEMLFRSEKGLPASALPGLRDFTDFLDFYGELAAEMRHDIHGLKHSPFIESRHFQTQDDARRKAEEVRSWLRVGLGPVPDIDEVAERLGITVFRADLGEDIRTGISGGFLRHEKVGFAIVINTMMTPGRQRFSVAHELAHALFHSKGVSLSTQRRDANEKFADFFASEFLMPTEGLRRLLEEYGMSGKIDDPADAVRIQRSFNVSWAMTLVRLRQAKLVTSQTYSDFSHVRPVLLARRLGYETTDDEYGPDRRAWRIARFPRRFWRLARAAVHQSVLSVPTLAAHTKLTLPEVTSIVADADYSEVEEEDVRRELDDFEQSRVFS